MSPSKTNVMASGIATIIGASGLIGNYLVEQLVAGRYYSAIRVIARRPLSFTDPSIDVRVIDFADINAFKSAIDGSEAVFCAVGTTRKKVKGDMIAYRKVDFDIPVNAASLCAETGCRKFLLVSSVGANRDSNNFYLKLKGEAEDAVKGKDIETIFVFRPSMLLGERKEARTGESVAKALAGPLSFLFPERYKPVHGRNVARAMIEASKSSSPGFHICHYREIMDLARKID